MGYTTIVKNQNIKKLQKSVFIGPSEKLKAFRFFYSFQSILHCLHFTIPHVAGFSHITARTSFEVRLSKLGYATIRKNQHIGKWQKSVFIGFSEKLRTFRFFYSFLTLNRLFQVNISLFARFRLYQGSLLGSVLFM